MKMLSGQSAPRGDKHHFVLNDGEYLNHLRDIVVIKLKAGTFLTAHFYISCLSRDSWPLNINLADHKGTQRGAWALR